MLPLHVIWTSPLNGGLKVPKESVPANKSELTLAFMTEVYGILPLYSIC